MTKRTALLTVALAAALTGVVSAQSLYRYLDANGRVVYSDQPPPPTAKERAPSDGSARARAAAKDSA